MTFRRIVAAAFPLLVLAGCAGERHSSLDAIVPTSLTVPVTEDEPKADTGWVTLDRRPDPGSLADQQSWVLLEGDWELFSSAPSISSADGFVTSAAVSDDSSGKFLRVLFEMPDDEDSYFALPVTWPEPIEPGKVYVDESPRRERMSFVYHSVQLDAAGQPEVLHMSFLYHWGQYNVAGELVFRSDAAADVAVVPLARTAADVD